MNYPKRCVKCDQFGSWCFCILPTPGDEVMIRLYWSSISRGYFAKYKDTTLKLDMSDKAVKLVGDLGRLVGSKPDGAGGWYVPHTLWTWSKLLGVGELVS